MKKYFFVLPFIASCSSLIDKSNRMSNDQVDSSYKKLIGKPTGLKKLNEENPQIDIISFIINKIPFLPQKNPFFYKDSKGRNLIHDAALKNQVDILKYYLNSESVEFYDYNYNNIDNHNNIVRVKKVKRVKLEYNALLNARDNDGYTPFDLAVLQGNIEVIKTLLEDEMVNVNARDNDGHTPFDLAVLQGNIEVIKTLLENERIDVNARDNNGYTPLHLAVSRNNINIEVVKTLLENERINVNARDNYGNTLLHKAVLQGNVEAIKILLDNERTNVNIKNNQGYAPLYISLTNNVEVIKTLLENERIYVNVIYKEENVYYTPLLLVAGNKMIARPSVGVVEELIKNPRTKVNVTDRQGRTPIHLASRSNKVSMVAQLLENDRVNVNARDNHGDTPLHLAVSRGCVEVVESLLKNKRTDVNAKNEYGETALDSAYGIRIILNKDEYGQGLKEKNKRCIDLLEKALKK